MKKNKKLIGKSIEGIDVTFNIVMLILVLSILKNIYCIVKKMRYMKKVKKFMWLINMMTD